MKYRHSTALKLTFKTSLLLSFLLISFSGNLLAQDSPLKSDARVRYISSAPKARLVSEPGKVRFVKRSTSAPNTASPSKLEPTDFNLERTAFKFINEKRRDNGLDDLVWSEQAAKLARVHSENMAKYNFFSHTGLNGRMIDQRALDFGLDDWKSIGENIAFCKGFSNPADFVVQRWMLSDGHRRNLLNRTWKESAIGMAKSEDGRYYFTQVFIVK